jgi:rod shape-determining protein MreC
MPRNKVAWRRVVFVVLIIASLAVLTVAFREPASGPVHSIQKAVGGLAAPLQSWGDRIAQPFQNGYTWLTTIWSAHKDADRLAKQVQVLQGKVIELQEQSEENQRLKGLLDLKDKGTFPTGTDFLVARVIAKSATRWENYIVIDKGSADGLKLNQAVVGATPFGEQTLAGKGLVGKVTALTPHSAKVLLITDSESVAAAKIQGSRAEGMVEGDLSDMLLMNYVDRDIKVDPKLVVVTSGYGGVFPADIPIGIVANVGEQDVNNYKKIEVEPFLDFRVLEEVMVLIVPDDGSTGPVDFTTSTTARMTTTTAATSTTSTTGTTGTTSSTSTTSTTGTTTTTSVAGTDTTDESDSR